MAKGARWGKADDAKLVQLWRTPHNGVDPTKLDQESVKAVHAKHFSQFKYVNFAPLYRGKARDFNVNQTLDGHRKRQAEARNAQEPSSSAAEDEYEEEKDESENEYFYSEDDEDMPDTTPKKATSRPHSAKKAAAKVEDVTDQLEALALGKTKLFSTEFKLPYMIFMYPDNDDVMVKVEFFGPMLPEFSFKPDVINGGAALELKVECPEIFCNNTRSLIVNGDADGFNNNTSEAQAFKNTCDAIDEAYGFPDQLFGDPQVVQLPFSVEERIVSWSCNAFPNEMGELTDNLGGLQFHNIVTVTLRKLKVKKRTQGAFRVFAANGNNNGNA